MKELLRHLDRQSRTLTIYDDAGTEDQREALSQWLSGYGIAVRTVATDGAPLADVAVLHSEGTVHGACAAERFRSRLSFEEAIENGEEPPIPELLASMSPDVTVQPARTVEEMVGVSREFERRALREGAGTLHAGFQHLSQIANSERTMEMYRALATEGVDVRVYGNPNRSIEGVPFTVVADEDRELDRHWFLLYDGGKNPQRRAALVSEERAVDGAKAAERADDGGTPAGVYDSFFTTDPETVDDLFRLARQHHADLLCP